MVQGQKCFSFGSGNLKCRLDKGRGGIRGALKRMRSTEMNEIANKE